MPPRIDPVDAIELPQNISHRINALVKAVSPGGLISTAQVNAADADITWSAASTMSKVLVLTGTQTADRVVTLLPAGLASTDTMEIIRTGGGLFVRTVVDQASGNTIATLGQDQRGLFRFDGTNWSLVRIFGAYSSGTWTPVPVFATPGDSVMTPTSQLGEWYTIGPWCHVAFRLVFNTNAYTTASGTFQITGLPYAGGGTTVAKSFAFGGVSNVTIPSGYFDVRGSVSGSAIALNKVRTANTITTAGTDAVLPSITGVRFEGQFFYRIGV